MPWQPVHSQTACLMIRFSATKRRGALPAASRCIQACVQHSTFARSILLTSRAGPCSTGAISPHADVKLFVTASAEIRAERRFKEMQGRGASVEYETILADIRARDKRDSERADAPLKPAEDAHLLDTGNLTIGAAVQRAIALVDAKIENRPA